MAELAARYGVSPNLIANWKTKARQQVLAGLSGNPERQEASREAEIQQLRAKIGEGGRGGFQSGINARRDSACCGVKISSRCRGSWVSRPRGLRSGATSSWRRARPA